MRIHSMPWTYQRPNSEFRSGGAATIEEAKEGSKPKRRRKSNE